MGESERISRRTFLKLAAGTAAAVGLAAAGLPIPTSAEAPNKSAKEQGEGEPLTGFGNLPIVEGESIKAEVEGLEQLLVNPSPVNYRQEANGPIWFVETLPQNSFLRQTTDTVTKAGDYEWIDTELLFVSDNVQVRETEEVIPKGLLVEPLPGSIFTGGVSKAADVPGLVIPEEVTALFTPNIEMPAGGYSLTAAETGTLLEGIGGGPLEVEVKKKMLAAWGDTAEIDEESFVSKWKSAVYVAASIGFEDKDNESTVATIAQMTRNDGLLNLVTQKIGDKIQVFTRLSDGDETIFIVSEAIQNEDPLDISFTNVAPTNWEGLNVLLGKDKAQEIASNLTEVRGNESVELAWGVNELSQAKVLLAGMPEGTRFAEQLANPRNSENEEFAGTYQYVREGDAYAAQFTDEDGTVRAKATYSVVEGKGQWIELTESTISEECKRFLEIKQVTPDVVMQSAVIEGIVAADGLPVSILSYEGVPLLYVHKETGEWREATTRTLFDIAGMEFGTSADGAEDWRNSEYQKALGKYFSITKAVGFNPEDMVKYRMPDNWKIVSKEQNTRLYAGALFSHYDVDPALREGNPSVEQVRESMDARIREVLGHIKTAGKGMVDVVAEAMWWSNGEGWEQSVYYKTFQRNFIAEAYERTYRIAQEMGMEIGEDLELLYNEYGVEIPGPKSDFVYRELNYTKQEVARRLGIQPEDVKLGVGMEFHIFTDQSNPNWVGGSFSGDITKEKVLANIERFSQLGPVHITELQVNYSQDTAEIQRLIDLVIDAAMESGKVDSITLYESLRFSNLWNAVNSGLFEPVREGIEITYQPTEAYYKLQSTILNNLKG